MKELGQKGDMVKLVRDVLFVNVQLTEEESPYSPRRDRLKHQTDSVTCLTKGDESALYRNATCRDSLVSVLMKQNRIINLRAYCDRKILS